MHLSKLLFDGSAVEQYDQTVRPAQYCTARTYSTYRTYPNIYFLSIFSRSHKKKQRRTENRARGRWREF